MKKLLLASALTTLTLTAAHAADAIMYNEPVMEAPVVTSFNWNGAYIGAQAGYAWGNSPYYSEYYDMGFNYDPDGLFGGIYAGCPSSGFLGQ